MWSGAFLSMQNGNSYDKFGVLGNRVRLLVTEQVKHSMKKKYLITHTHTKFQLISVKERQREREILNYECARF